LSLAILSMPHVADRIYIQIIKLIIYTRVGAQP
jgi:hypothetical protein